MIRFITFLWLTFMLFLSHIPGGPSGEESRWLSRMTGVKEGVLRRAAHVVVYLVLGVLATVGWLEISMWLRVLVLAGIGIADETSKALPLFPGRHCSASELGLNIIGLVAGLVLGELLIF